MSVDANPQEVLSGFEKRVDAMFRAESERPLARAAKRQPLGPGRGNYVRHYSWSMVEFAARCLYLGEMLEEANAALVENARHYLDNPRDINDHDSFHWHADVVLRLVEIYGTGGRRAPGRVTPETEAVILEPVWIYARQYSKLSCAEHETSQTWHIYESENHHAMIFTLCWHFSGLARNRPEYRDRKYEDGATAAEHYRAWSEYFVVYCRERARKGMFIEMQNDMYNGFLIKGIYSFHDFGEPPVRRAAGLLLDLYWAYWAQEQIDGVQGGGRSRVYFQMGLGHAPGGEGATVAWYYFGMGRQRKPLCPCLHAALSDYRPPAVVAAIALDVEGRGRYEVRQRPLGLATAPGLHPYKVDTAGGDILRYSYCDPAFIIGTPMNRPRPREDWTDISSQNRWQGAIFSGAPGARILPIVRPENSRVAMNALHSVQSRGSLLTQKLKYHRGGAEMIVWISEEGLSSPVEEDGIVFVESAGAYAAVQVIAGGYSWQQLELPLRDHDESLLPQPAGRVMVLEEGYAPVMLQVTAKRDAASFEAFKARVKACTVTANGPVLTCGTIYGDSLTLDTSAEEVPAVNGQPVDFAPEKAFDSPFLTGNWNSGVVTVRKGTECRVLDFR